MASTSPGQAAVARARWAVDAHVGLEPGPEPPVPAGFRRKGAAFVTLLTHPGRRLRGCMGYAGAVLPLADTLDRAAVAACQDPRFPHLTAADDVVVEVSLLAPPTPLRVASPLEYRKAIVPGRDGLTVAYGASLGLLLPQVARQEGWTPEDFLSQACMKAGLLPDAWFEPGVRVATFRAEVFVEERPRGPVRRRPLEPVHDGH